MPKVDDCRNECGVRVFVKQDPNDGKWKPYEEQTGQLHDCPKSPYNLKKQQGEAYRTPKTSSLTDIEQALLENDRLIIKQNEEMKEMLKSVLSGRSFEELEE